MKPETRIVNKITKAFDRLKPDIWYFKVHGSPMQMAGVPDIVGCYRGRFFGLEVKVPGNVPTKLQEKVMSLIRDAGGIVAVVTSPAEALATIENQGLPG